MKCCVGLTFDLRSEYLAAGYSEEDVLEFDSDATVDSLEEAIQACGYKTDRIGSGRRLCERLVAGDRWDLVFNIAEGLHGRARESQVPCILDLYDVPYTMSDPRIHAVTLDKALTKRVVQAAGLATPAFMLVMEPEDCHKARLRYPLFAKPVAEGTGKGITQASRIETPAQLLHVCTGLLKRFQQPVLVEEYLPGREFTVGLLGSGSRARALGTLEVNILPSAGGTVYSNETKENWEQHVRYVPLREPDLKRTVEQLALDSYRALECLDCGRADIRLDAEGKPSFMEINSLPGLKPHHSDLPMLADAEGISYTELIRGILDSAMERVKAP